MRSKKRDVFLRAEAWKKIFVCKLTLLLGVGLPFLGIVDNLSTPKTYVLAQSTLNITVPTFDLDRWKHKFVCNKSKNSSSDDWRRTLPTIHLNHFVWHTTQQRRRTSVILLLLSLSPSLSLSSSFSLFFLSLSGHGHKQVHRNQAFIFIARAKNTPILAHVWDSTCVSNTVRSTFKKRNSEIRQTGRIKALHSQRTWLWNLLVPQTSLRQTQVAPPTDNGLAPPPMKSATSVATTSSAIVESMNWQQNRVSTKRYCCAMTEPEARYQLPSFVCQVFHVRACFVHENIKYIYIYIYIIYTHMHTIHEYESLSNVYDSTYWSMTHN